MALHQIYKVLGIEPMTGVGKPPTTPTPGAATGDAGAAGPVKRPPPISPGTGGKLYVVTMWEQVSRGDYDIVTTSFSQESPERLGSLVYAAVLLPS